MSTKRVVVVTGGASGIGLGICTLFARSGHQVAMLDLEDAALKREGAKLRAAGATILARNTTYPAESRPSPPMTQCAPNSGRSP